MQTTLRAPGYAPPGKLAAHTTPSVPHSSESAPDDLPSPTGTDPLSKSSSPYSNLLSFFLYPLSIPLALSLWLTPILNRLTVCALHRLSLVSPGQEAQPCS